MFSLFRTKITLYVTVKEHEEIEAWAKKLGIKMSSDLDPQGGDELNWFRIDAENLGERVDCVYRIRNKEHVTLFNLMWSQYMTDRAEAV